MPKITYPLKLWYRWKSLRLPWRRQWLCGYDLAGHTFWEFIDPLQQSRPRRIVKYPRSTHYGDVAIPPAWLQWLRKTRPDAPSITEQQFDIQRQSNLKQLAARADQRWREQESYLDNPESTSQPQPLMEPNDPGGYVGAVGGPKPAKASRVSVDDVNPSERDDQKIEAQERLRDDIGSEAEKPKPDEKSPWIKHAKGPGEGWQPATWSPGKLGAR